MIRKMKYTTENISKIYSNLTKLSESNNSTDYEIRIDDLVVVTRTKELDRFYSFKEFLDGTSYQLDILLYKKTSRKNDTYSFYLNNEQSPLPELTADEYVRKKVEEALFIQKKKIKYKSLKRKVKEQTIFIEELKADNKELRTNRKGSSEMFTQLLSKVASNGNLTGATVVANETNLPKEIIDKISYARKQYGDEALGKSLGITLKCLENPDIMDKVIDFITNEIIENEKAKEN